MSFLLARFADMRRGILAIVLTLAAAGCASSGNMQKGRAAEDAQDYDRAVVEYTNIVRQHPENRDARESLGRAKLRAAQSHTAKARRYAGLGRWEEAVVEYQLSAELNPTDSTVSDALKDARQKLRARGARF